MTDGYKTSCETAVFGGTFDPVHNGHTGIARHIVDHGLSERVLFVPCATAPHKLDLPTSDGRHRQGMLELALASDPCLAVSAVEIDRGGISYTIDTARALSAGCGGPYSFVIGTDSLNELHLWHEAVQLVEECRFLIYRRPAHPPASRVLLASRFGDGAAGRLLASVIDDVPEFDISSSEIREQIISGESGIDHLHEDVARYIADHQLYRG